MKMLSIGKIGAAVCKLLLERGGVEITIFSSYVGIVHPNVKYTQSLADMASFKYVLVGKMLPPKSYQKALSLASPKEGGPQYLLDYTVPYFPLVQPDSDLVIHVQIGILKVASFVLFLLNGHAVRLFLWVCVAGDGG